VVIDRDLSNRRGHEHLSHLLLLVTVCSFRGAIVMPNANVVVGVRRNRRINKENLTLEESRWRAELYDTFGQIMSDLNNFVI